jgi:hypothetical protein
VLTRMDHNCREKKLLLFAQKIISKVPPVFTVDLCAHK